MAKRLGLCVLMLALLLGWSGLALAQGAKLYELTENMSIAGVSRIAVAALQGSADLGTPLCPASVFVTNPKAQTCTVTAVGKDDVDMTTGQGTVGGTYAVVVQDINLVDGPEFVVQTGTFSGHMDLSPVLAGVPLGFITDGIFTIDVPVGQTIPTFKFSGTFRLPFALSPGGKPTKPVSGKNAYYLGDTGLLVKVNQNELSLGIPTVRFEVTFGQ